MKIVHICTMDHGGAGIAAYRLHKGLLSIGIDSKMIVLLKNQLDDSIFKVIDENNRYENYSWNNLSEKWTNLVSSYTNKSKDFEIFTDITSDFDITNNELINKADIINLHWVSGIINYESFFDKFRSKKIVWTLHDMNPFTGGCHFAFDCDQYQEKCGRCIILGSENEYDISSKLWEKKNKIYCDLNLNIVTPSQWLKSCAEISSLFTQFNIQVIPYGVPTDIFKSYDQNELKKSLKIPENKKIILFGASYYTERKGIKYLLEAIEIFSKNYKREDVIFASFGPFNFNLPNKKIPFINLGMIATQEDMAKVYSLADMVIVPSIEDNLPNVVIEAMSCGTPVIAFNAGGIPDMITHKKDGYLAEKKDSNDLFQGILWAFEANNNEVTTNARNKVLNNYSLSIQANNYMKLYKNIIHKNETLKKRNNTSIPIKVSAIVSTYNSEKFIHGCLDDLISQTLYKKDELEIIIVNSGSAENEDEIVREYEEKYSNIIYIRTDEREGIYTAWNRGIKAASGKYITNANTDDRHKYNALEVSANILDKMPGIDLVYYDLKVTKQENQTFDNCNVEWIINRPNYKKNIMLEGCHMGPQPMWRKTVHEKIGYFNEAYKSAGDYEFWMRLVFNNGSQFFHIDEVLGLYMFNENGIELSNVSGSKYETAIIKETYTAYFNYNNSVNSEKPVVDIVFLSHNRLKYLHQTIQTLYKNTKHPFNLFVVDNDSGEEVLIYLKQTEILYKKIIFNKKNIWTAAFQKGIELTKSDPFIVSDPDILVPELSGKCWLERLIDLHDDNQEMGLIALNLDDSNKPEKLPDVYLGEKQILNDEITISNVGTVMQSIKRKYFDFPYITDWETCERIRRNGGKVGFAKNIVAYHLGWNEETDYPDYIVDKHKYFKNIYNVDTYKMYTTDESILNKMDKLDNNYFGYSRPEVQQLVNDKAKRILDVGCGAGRMASELKEKNNAEVWGIEIVPEQAKLAAEKIDKVLVGNVEEQIKGLPNDYFDTIIFADILEHLQNPEEILKKLKNKLSSSGEIVISIPNVRHWSVIKALLEGTWKYEDAGILDRTHLKFFTLETASQMIMDCGFNIQNIEATKMNDTTFSNSLIKQLEADGFHVNDLQENAKHYQYRFKAVKKVDKLVSLIIPVFNQIEYTMECINSIYEYTNENFELVIINNASNEATKEKLEHLSGKHKNVSIINNSINLGFPTAINQGLSKAKGEYIVLANNDIVLTKNWLGKLIKIADYDQNIGIIGPISNKVSGVQLDKNANYGSINEMHNYALEIEMKNKGEIQEFPRVAFLCTLIKREVIEKIGGLDEQFSPGNYEDDDFCLRAQLAGFKTAIAMDVFVHHYGSSSFKAEGDNKYENLLEVNRQKFIRKWGATPDDIWLHNVKPSDKKLHIPLSGQQLEINFANALSAINNENYDDALTFLDKCLELFDEISDCTIDKNQILNLKSKISKMKTL